MPGQPKARALRALITAKGGEAWLWDRISSGDKMRELAASLSCSLGTLYAYVNHPSRSDAYKAARLLSTHAMVEEAGDIVDATEGETEPASVRSAELRAGHRRWTAERINRPDYGQPTPQTNLTINMASLHLDTLKATPLPSHDLSLPPASHASSE